MAIDSSTFISDIVLFLRNILREELVDPLGRNAEKYVFTAFPKVNTQYPLVTVKATNATSKKLGMSSEVSWIDMKIEIRAWCRNSKEVDVTAQDIINVVREAQYGTGSTTEEQIFGFTLESMNPIVEGEGEENTIHSKVMTFKFNAILQ